MKISSKIYKAKILLFGEYSVINGSDALAIPTDLFSGRWDLDPLIAQEQGILYDFHAYLSKLDLGHVNFQEQLFNEDLDRHLIFNSNIPIGYGAGSSGAVCAAIFDRYFQKDSALDILPLKKILATMENFFHGSSSGLDPLVSYLDQAIVIQNQAIAHFPLLENNTPLHLFLLDTGMPRKTEPLVQLYLEKYRSDSMFQKLIETDLSAANNQAIKHYLNQDKTKLFQYFHRISSFQMKHFNEMIPQDYQLFWQQGLGSDLYKIKLCGAGGGGFLLGMTNDWEAIRGLASQFANLKLKLLKIA